MANQIPNQFTQFQLSDEEELSGMTMSHTQLMVIQNLRAEYSIRKLNLVYTPDAHQQYLQEEAEISGWLNCLNYIMDCNENARQAAINAANNSNRES
jgi:hypothetical protein